MYDVSLGGIDMIMFNQQLVKVCLNIADLQGICWPTPVPDAIIIINSQTSVEPDCSLMDQRVSATYLPRLDTVLLEPRGMLHKSYHLFDHWSKLDSAVDSKQMAPASQKA